MKGLERYRLQGGLILNRIANQTCLFICQLLGLHSVLGIMLGVGDTEKPLSSKCFQDTIFAINNYHVSEGSTMGGPPPSSFLDPSTCEYLEWRSVVLCTRVCFKVDSPVLDAIWQNKK